MNFNLPQPVGINPYATQAKKWGIDVGLGVPSLDAEVAVQFRLFP
jgi:hypothetical protein